MKNIVLVLALLSSAIGCERIGRKASQLKQESQVKAMETKVSLGNDKDLPLAQRQAIAKDLLDNAEMTEQQLFNAAIASGCKITDSTKVAAECTTEQLLADDHVVADLVFEAESNWTYLSRVTELGKLMGAPTAALVNTRLKMSRDRVASLTGKRLDDQVRDMKPLEQNLKDVEAKLKNELGIVFVKAPEAEVHSLRYDVFVADPITKDVAENSYVGVKKLESRDKYVYALLMPKVVGRALNGQSVAGAASVVGSATATAVRERTQQLLLDYARVANPLQKDYEKAYALSEASKRDVYEDREQEVRTKKAAVGQALVGVLVVCESKSQAPCVGEGKVVIFEKN